MKKSTGLITSFALVLILGGCSSPYSSGNPPAASNPAATNQPAAAVNPPPAANPSVATNTPSTNKLPAVANPPVVSKPPAPPAGGLRTESVAIAIQNFAFDPQTKTITRGSTVTWTNNDSVPHQIKSTTFNSGILAQGQSYSFTFNAVGLFGYSCAIHPSMTGTIIVQ